MGFITRRPRVWTIQYMGPRGKNWHGKNICNKTLKKLVIWDLSEIYEARTHQNQIPMKCCVVFFLRYTTILKHAKHIGCPMFKRRDIYRASVWWHLDQSVYCNRMHTSFRWGLIFWQILRITRILMYIHKSKSLKFVLPSGKLSHNYGKSPFSSWVNPRNFYGHGFNSKLLT